jgi:hypothetical protein
MKVHPYQHRHPTTGVTSSSEGIDAKLWVATQLAIAFFPTWEERGASNAEMIRAVFTLTDDFLTQYEGEKK